MIYFVEALGLLAQLLQVCQLCCEDTFYLDVLELLQIDILGLEVADVEWQIDIVLLLALLLLAFRVTE